MNKRLLLLTAGLVLSLTLLSCVSASDVNETVTVEEDNYEIVIDNTAVYEDEIDDVQVNSSATEITQEHENPVIEDSFNNQSHSHHKVEVIVNNVEQGKNVIDFNTENYETPVIEGNFNNSKFCDMNLESDELILDATFNNHILITSPLNFSLDDVACFEIFQIKMENFDSALFKKGKFNNSLPIKHELVVYSLHDNSFEIYMDSNIVICSNKVTDNFAYSINNSITDDESGVYFSFNSFSYFINQNYLFFNKFSCF